MTQRLTPGLPGQQSGYSVRKAGGQWFIDRWVRIGRERVVDAVVAGPLPTRRAVYAVYDAFAKPRNGRTNPWDKQRLRQRIEDGSIPEPNSGCWLWTGATNKSGYADMGVGRFVEKAARVSIFAYKGPLGDGHDACHHCDNPPCVNPDHLFSGTRSENVRDMVRKGRCLRRGDPRLAHGDRNGSRAKPESHPKGERHGCAILTEDRVREIAAMVASGRTRVSVARELGISATTVAQIARKETWRHLWKAG